MPIKGSPRKTAAKKRANYVTKRVLKSAIDKAFRKASASTRKSIGYVIKAENGWVIREELDGRKTRLSKINKSNHPLALD
jgi:hypothetical protein